MSYRNLHGTIVARVDLTDLDGSRSSFKFCEEGKAFGFSEINGGIFREIKTKIDVSRINLGRIWVFITNTTRNNSGLSNVADRYCRTTVCQLGGKP